MNNMEKIDRNFAVTAPQGKDRAWLDIEQAPFQVYGLMREDGRYVRLPCAVAEQVSEGVAFLNGNTAGGRVRFATDSPVIGVRAVMHSICKMPHFTLCGSAGFDLYEDTTEKSVYRGTFMPPYEMEDGYESELFVGEGGLRRYTVCFPLYSGVKTLEIGLQNGCTLAAGKPYKPLDPIVYYGSSITQGGCASRPGNAYENILTRRLNADHINLGFSGSAKAEDAISDYIAQLKMSAFVYDYDHNAPTAEYLSETHEKMFRHFRAAQPTTPVILMCRPQPNPSEDDLRRLNIIERTYENARKRGDKNVHLINMHRAVADFCGDCATVDNCHPNDLGFMAMAKAVLDVIRADS